MNAITSSPVTSTFAIIPLLKGIFGVMAAAIAFVHADVAGVSITADPYTLIQNALPYLSIGGGLLAAKDWNTSGSAK